jgi:pimeloyl-ACP methyl ester carboxylesterase
VEPNFVSAGEIRVDGVRTPFVLAGDPAHTEAVVFVHGNPGSRLDWHPLISRAGNFARAVAFDLPGFGSADKPASFDYSVPGYARFVAGALRELGIERVHLVIHDFGGPIGLAWAATDPEAFASVVIVNAPPVSGYRWYLLAKVWKTPGAGELLHWTLTKPTFRFLLRRGQPKGLPREAVDRMARDYDRGTQRAVLRLYRSADAAQLVPAPASFFASLDRPGLIVWGRQDVYIPNEFAERHRLAFPSADIVYLPESGHFPMLDDPEATAEAILPFLRERVAGTS